MSLQKIVIESAPGVPANADDDVSAASKINAAFSKVDAHESKLGDVDSVLAMAGDLTGAVGAAQAAKDSAGVSSNAAIAAKDSITDELAQVTAKANEATAAAALAVATSIGDEDYTIPAVSKLILQPGIVATAVSDDVWAEHAYKWGGPSAIFAVTDGRKVTLYDLTKPSIPIWKEFISTGILSLVWTTADVAITSIKLIGSLLIIGNKRVDTYPFTGIRIADFANDKAYAFGGEFGYGAPNPDEPSKSLDNANDSSFFIGAEGGYTPVGDYKLVGGFVNSLDAFIDADSPHHPISNIPMPTIAVGTLNGVTELVPNNSDLIVRNVPNTNIVSSVSYDKSGYLHVCHDDGSNSSGTGNPKYLLAKDGIVIRNSSKSAPGIPIFNDSAFGWGSKYYGLHSMYLVEKGSVQYLSIIKENPSESGRSLVAHMSKDSFAAFNVADNIPSTAQAIDIERDTQTRLKYPLTLTDNITALAYDTVRNQGWIATAGNKLHRLEGTCFVETLNVDPAVGDISALTIYDGKIIIGGSLGLSINLKAKNLRETKVITMAKSQHGFLGEGDSNNTDFYLQHGWKPMRVEVDGIVKQKGANKTWTEQFDGYRYFIRFKVAPGIFPISCLMQEVK